MQQHRMILLNGVAPGALPAMSIDDRRNIQAWLAFIVRKIAEGRPNG